MSHDPYRLTYPTRTKQYDRIHIIVADDKTILFKKVTSPFFGYMKVDGLQTAIIMYKAFPVLPYIDMTHGMQSEVVY